MYLLRKPPDFRSINAFVRLYSLARKNHYDVLKLRKNCTDKDIKEAFIKMSKEYHPDKNKDVKAQEKFVSIVEAYNVLGKPGSRAQYDSVIEIPTGGSSYTTSASYVYRTHVPHNLRNNPNYSYYYETSNSASEGTASKERPPHEWYYGFKGIKKLPNYYIICICLGFAFVGVVLQMYVIRNMYAIQRSRAQERSKYLANELDKVRTSATENGNELQTRLLLDKIVSAANPTVTTASLGRALANEDKEHTDALLTEFGVGSTDEWYEVDDDKVNLYDIIREVINYIII